MKKHSLVFRKCSQKELLAIKLIQDKTLATLEDKNLLRQNTLETLAECLSEPHYTLGAFDGAKLAGYGILYVGGNTTENLGQDIHGINNPEKTVINLKLTIVDHDYRGRGLQKELVSSLEKLAKEKGFIYICTTISPKNKHSITNLVQMGYQFVIQVTKYNNLTRNLYIKTLV